MNRASRKLSAFITGAALVAVATSPLAAQQSGTWEFNARGGVAVPAGKLTDASKAGPTVGIGAAYWITPRIGLSADHDMSFLQGKTIGTAQASDLNLWQYGGGAIVSLLNPATTHWLAYASLGAGATTFDPRTTGASTSTRFTTNGGLRLGYRVGRSADVFLGSQAYLMFVDKTDWGSSTTWNFPINAGLKLRV
ncbi:MAG TPA: outer membrane beta-barrel protein [Gemmatimonadota bacterium]|nr:outer membrane beta-barrel protein [Gemmatimonadota bacterium]